MTRSSPREVAVVLLRGAAFREAPLYALAAAIPVPIDRLVRVCTFLLNAATSSTGDSASNPMGEGVGGEGTFNVPRSERSFNNNKENVQRSLEKDNEENPSATGLVDRLVRDLDDEKSRAYFEKLVAAHPRSLIEHALQEALAVPAERIRRSRGAYFVSVLRALPAGKHSSSPYA